MDDFDIGYARSKTIPDILERGCRIETDHGEIEISPGWAAVRIALVVDLYLLLQGSVRERSI